MSKSAGALCDYCHVGRPQLQRPKTGCRVCKACFIRRFEDEIHETIVGNKLFTRGERVVLGASGGKDSTVLAHVMKTLNDRYDYGIELYLLSIDEGIRGYRDDSLETVKRNQQQYELPLKILSYKDLYGWSMDEIVAKIGLKQNCTVCGVFRRQALDRGAQLVGADKLLTGHNCDDIAETVLINLLRGDIARLGRCTDIITASSSGIPRAKPFKFTYEKEIVLYAHFLELDYFSTECRYAPYAYRGVVREFMKDLERASSRALVDIVHAAEFYSRHVQSQAEGSTESHVTRPEGRCSRCGFMSSQEICQACSILEGLNSPESE